MNRYARKLFAVFAAILAAPIGASGAAFDFEVSSGFWRNPNNWSNRANGLPGVPGPNDTAFISDMQVCTLDDDREVLGVAVLGGELIVQNATLRVGGGEEPTGIALTGTITLSVTDAEIPARISVLGPITIEALPGSEIRADVVPNGRAVFESANGSEDDHVSFLGGITLRGSLTFDVNVTFERNGTSGPRTHCVVENAGEQMTFGDENEVEIRNGVYGGSPQMTASGGGRISFRRADINTLSGSIEVVGDGDADVGTVAFEDDCTANATTLNLIVHGGVVDVETMVLVYNICFSRGRIEVAAGNVLKADPPG